MKDIYNILIIEDDKSEQKLLSMILSQSGYPVNPVFIGDGETALNYIETYEAASRGKLDLIFIDLNLPKVSGFEIIKSIKSNDRINLTPVIVLTTSKNRTDVENAYRSGISGYIRKPSVIDEYEETVRHVLKYWLEICITY